MVEIKTRLKVKCLKSDNGGEYIDGEFSEYCVAQGIMMEKTIPWTPQQNGVAERMNRILNKCARSMRCPRNGLLHHNSLCNKIGRASCRERV